MAACLLGLTPWSTLGSSAEAGGRTGAPRGPVEAGQRLLVCRLGELSCAVEARSVREVLPVPPATRVPGAQPAVLGLVNVRGSLIPVLDGRRALGFPPREGGSLLVVEVAGRLAGLVVDEAQDLISVAEGDWAERADLPGVDRRWVQAVGRSHQAAFVLLDLSTLLEPLLPA